MVTCNEPAATAARHIRGGLRDSLHLSAIAAIRWNPGIAALDRRLKHGGRRSRGRPGHDPAQTVMPSAFVPAPPGQEKSGNFHGKRIILTEVLARVVHECARQALQTCMSTVGQAVENLWKTCLRRTHQTSEIRPGRAGLPPWMLRVVPTLEQIPLLHGKCGCETRVALPRASALRMHEQLRGTGGWSWRHSGGTGTSARGVGPAPAGPGTGFGEGNGGEALVSNPSLSECFRDERVGKKRRNYNNAGKSTVLVPKSPPVWRMCGGRREALQAGRGVRKGMRFGHLMRRELLCSAGSCPGLNGLRISRMGIRGRERFQPSDAALRITLFVDAQGRLGIQRECVLAILSQCG